MSLTQLIYVSRWSGRLLRPALEVLVAQSAFNNRSRNISGVLLVHGQALMQLLEGDGAVIDGLIGKIRSDTRHSQVEVLLRKAVGRRLYPEWGMGLTDLNSPLVIDRDRMRRMVSDVQSGLGTARFSVESRILLRDFEEQARFAA